MYYFSCIDDKIEKYEVDFDRKKLLQSREEIILNCSEIHHCEYEGTVGPKVLDPLKIKNFHQIKVGMKEYRNCCAPDQPVYYFCYDECEYPYLVTLIDRLLNGDVEVICDFFNINMDKEPLPFELRIENLLKEASQINDISVDEKISKLVQLKNMIELSKQNCNQKSVYEYYYKVRDFIYIQYVGDVSLSDVCYIQEFVGINLNELNSFHVEIPKKMAL